MTDLKSLQTSMDRIAMAVGRTLREHIPPDTVPGNHFDPGGWDGEHWHSTESPDAETWKYFVRPPGVFGLGDDGAYVLLTKPRPAAEPPPHETVGPLEILRKVPAKPFEETYTNRSDGPVAYGVHFEHRDTTSTSLDVEVAIKTGFEAQFGNEASPVSAKLWGEVSTSIKTASGIGVEDAVSTDVPDIIVAPQSKRTVIRERFETDARRDVTIAGRMDATLEVHDAYRFTRWFWTTLDDFVLCFRGGAPRFWSYDRDVGRRLNEHPAPAAWADEFNALREVSYTIQMPIAGSSYGQVEVGPNEPIEPATLP